MLGPRGPLVFMALVIGISLVLIYRDKGTGPLRPGIFVAMLGESVILALLFGVVVGTATMQLLGPAALTRRRRCRRLGRSSDSRSRLARGSTRSCCFAW